MSAYRLAPLPLSKAPSAPWWRLLRAWLTGTFTRMRAARDPRDREVRAREFGRYVNGVDIEADRDEQQRLGLMPARHPEPMKLPLPHPPVRIAK